MQTTRSNVSPLGPCYTFRVNLLNEYPPGEYNLLILQLKYCRCGVQLH